MIIHCYNFEHGIRKEYLAHGKLPEEIPVIFAYYYVIMKIAYSIGSFLFMTTVSTATVNRPWFPTVFQALNVALWTINVSYGLVDDFIAIFIWMMFVGALAGTEFVTFLFLAVAKTNLEHDMHLNFYERELVVNLLLMAYDLGTFYALYACHSLPSAGHFSTEKTLIKLRDEFLWPGMFYMILVVFLWFR